jgi:hypothetical protein
VITKIILGVLIIGFTLSLIDSAEGLVEFKKYKVINSPKVYGDKLCSEVDEKIAKKGESSHKIKVCGDRLCSNFSEKLKPINKSSPYGQFRLGVALDLIQCKEGQELVIRIINSLPDCIKSENIEKLREKGWAISEKVQQERFEEFIEDRKKGISSSRTIKDFDVSIIIIPEEINDRRYLEFGWNGWHGLHNVEITITGENFEESMRTKTDDRGHLNMPWLIPDNISGGIYSIFATDGIHEFEITIPISPSLAN